MKHDADREQRFLAITSEYKQVIAKVCYMYSSPAAPFDDLYQEVLVNLWQGLDSFRGDAKISTWLYRTAINTCITWHRRNSRHHDAANISIDDMLSDVPDRASEGPSMMEEYRELYRLINMLGPLDKALITLWLDEKSYDEIAAIMGLSKGNVAVKMHRIKDKLSRLAESEL